MVPPAIYIQQIRLPRSAAALRSSRVFGSWPTAQYISRGTPGASYANSFNPFISKPIAKALEGSGRPSPTFIPTQVSSAASGRPPLFRRLAFITSRGLHNSQLVIHEDLHLHQVSSDTDGIIGLWLV